MCGNGGYFVGSALWVVVVISVLWRLIDIVHTAVCENLKKKMVI